MSDNSYEEEEVGGTFLSGTAIFGAAFLLIAVLAATVAPSFGNKTQVQNSAPVETVVVTAPHAKVL